MAERLVPGNRKSPKRMPGGVVGMRSHVQRIHNLSLCEPRPNAIFQVFRGGDELHRQVRRLLPDTVLTEKHGPVAVNKPSHEMPAVFVRHVRPGDGKALVLAQSDCAQKRGGARRREVYANVAAPVLQAVIAAAQNGNHQVYQLQVFGRNLNRVAIKATIAPNQANQPREIVGPGLKQAVINRVAVGRHHQPGRLATPMHGALAHRVAIRDGLRPTVYTARLPTFRRTKLINALRPVVPLLERPSALLAYPSSQRCGSSHINIIAQVQRCHLTLDGPLHAAHAKQTRREKREREAARAGQQAMFDDQATS